MYILSNRYSLPNGIILKPDMNHEERNADSLSLKERWHLVKSGVLKAAINISQSLSRVCKQAEIW